MLFASSFSNLTRNKKKADNLPEFNQAENFFSKINLKREKSMSDFFAMGGYAFYVWTSYGLTFLLLFMGIIKPLLANKQILRSLLLKRKREQNQ